MTGSSQHTILCGFCKAPVRRRVEGDPDSQWGCAACGNWADYDEVRKTADQYFVDQAQLHLNRLARDAARKSKIMTFKGQTVSNKLYRFITDGKF